MEINAVYYLDHDRQRQGPVRADELAARGVTPDTLVWMQGMKTWVQAREVPELASYLASAAPAGMAAGGASPYAPEAPRQSGSAGATLTYGTGRDYRTEDDASEPRRGNAPGLTGFVLALFLLVVWIPGFNAFACLLMALVFSIVGLSRRPRGLAIAGLVISLLALLVLIVCLIIGASFLGSML